MALFFGSGAISGWKRIGSLLSAAVIFAGIILAEYECIQDKNNGLEIIFGDFLGGPDEKTTANRHMCSCCRMCRT